MPTQTELQTYNRLERLYGSPQDFDNELSSLGINSQDLLTGSMDPDADRRRLANIATVAIRTKKPVAEVVAAWDAQKRAFSSQVFGKEISDDNELYQTISSFMSEKRAERGMNEKLNDALFAQAALGKDYNEAYATVSGEFRGKEGWSDASEKKGVYQTATRPVFEQLQKNMKEFGPRIDRVFMHLSTSGGFEDNLDAIAEDLKDLPPNQANFIIDAAGAQWRSEGKKIQELAGDSSIGEGVLKIPLRFSRAGKELNKSALDELKHVGPKPSWLPFWRDDVEMNPQLRKEQIQRRIKAHMLGDMDELSGDSYFTEAMLKAVDTLPYSFTAVTPLGLPIVIASMRNDTRGKLIDEGLNPNDAEKVAEIAAPAMALIEMGQAKLAIFGRMNVGKKFFSELKDKTLKRVIARFGARAAAVEGGQLAEERLQDLTPLTVQEVFSWLDEDVPGANFKEELASWPMKTLEEALIFGPSSGWGGGSATRSDIQAANKAIDATNTRERLEGDGYQPQDVENILRIHKEGSRADVLEAIDEAAGRRDMTTERAEVARAVQSAQAEANAVPPELVVEKTENGYRISNKEGGLVGQAPTAETASAMVQEEKAKIDEGKEVGRVQSVIDKVEGMSLEEFRNTQDQRKRGTEEGSFELGRSLTSEKQVEALEKARAASEQRAKKLKEEKKIDESMDESLRTQYYREAIEAARGEKSARDELGPDYVPPLPEPQKRQPITPEKLTANTAEIKEPKIDSANDTPPVLPAELALNKKEIEILREVTGLQRLPEAQREQQAAVVNKVKLEGKNSGLDLAKELLVSPRQITNEEHAELLLALAAAENKFESHLREAIEWDARGNAKSAAAARMRADAALVQIDNITAASKYTNTLAGRALAFRKVRINREAYTVVQAVNRLRSVNGGKTIPPEVEKQLVDAANKIKELDAKVEELMAELRAKNEKENTENANTFVEEERKAAGRATKQQAQKRRQDAKNRLKALGYRLGIMPEMQSPEAAYLISEIGRSYIEEGATTLSDVIGKIKVDLPDVADNDIYNALGGRIKKERKKIDDAIERRVKELEKQAAMWAKIHDALEGKFDKHDMQPGSKRMQILREYLAQMRIQATRTIRDDAQRARLEAKLDLLLDQIANGYRIIGEGKNQRQEKNTHESLREAIRDAEQIMRTKDAIEDLKEQKRTGRYKVSAKEVRVIKNSELHKLQADRRALEKEIDMLIRKQARETWQNLVVGAWGTPRAMQSMIDASFFMKQGAWMLVKHPIISTKTLLGSTRRAAFSEREYDEIAVAIENHPNYAEFMMAGLKLTELDAKANSREEHFLQNLAERVRGLRAVVRGSNRAMITHLNMVRMAAMNNLVDGKEGLTSEDRQAFASYVNWATGRGSFGKAEGAIQVLNQVFYAPRFAVSRYQLLYSPIYFWKQPKVRNAILKDFAKFFGFHATVLALASAAGLEVGTDPDEWTFLRIKVGNTWYDLLGSLQQPMRLMFISLKRGKELSEGDTSKLSSMGTFWRFMKYKWNPAITTADNVLKGTDTFGRDDDSRLQLAAQGFTPIFLNESANLIENSETPQDAAMAAIASFLGSGTTTPEPKQPTSRTRQEPE